MASDKGGDKLERKTGGKPDVADDARKLVGAHAAHKTDAPRVIGKPAHDRERQDAGDVRLDGAAGGFTKNVKLGLRGRMRLMKRGRGWAAIGIGCLVVMAAAAAVLLLQNHKDTTALPKHVAGYTKYTSTNSVSNQAFSYANAGDYETAQKMLDDQLKQTTKDADKAQLYVVQTTLAINAKKYDDAKGYAAKAEQLEPTSETAGLLGDIAMAQNNKTAAQDYYQKALDRLDKKSPGYPLHRTDYAAKLEAAKK